MMLSPRASSAGGLGNTGNRVEAFEFQRFGKEAYESTELAGDLVDVGADERSLYESVIAKDVLLAGLSGLSLDCLCDGVAVSHLAGLECLKVGGKIGDGHVCDGVSEVLEIGVA